MNRQDAEQADSAVAGTPFQYTLAGQPPTPTAGGDGPNQTTAVELPLLPAHLAELRASGLSDEIIRAAGIYSETDRSKLAEITNRSSWSAKLGSAIVFPYRDKAGDVVLRRLKPDFPPMVKGKPAKYLSPSGAAVRVYLPPGAYERIEAGSVEIIITEGEKKALAGTQAGFCVLGLSGVDCWHPKKSTALLPDLELIEWRGRTAYIAFDSDAADNARVRENESLLAAALVKRGAAVKVVRLPAGKNGEKVGLDDLLLATGAAELRKLMDRAEPPAAPEPEALRQPAGDADPADVAAKVLTACERDGLPQLRFWCGSWWWWQGGRYIEKADAEVRAEVLGQFTRDWFCVKSRHISDAIEHVKAGTLLRGEIEPPAWLGQPPYGWGANECLATKGGIVHLPSLVSGSESSILPATPAFFTLNATEFDIDLNAPRPATWYWFLEALWGRDQQSIDTLQEIFGYLLTADTRHQKIFLLVGPTRSGKGTIARVFRKLAGEGNVAGPTLSSLATNFGLEPLIGKSVAIVSDARLSGRPDKAVVVERLLAISGADKLTIDRKHKTAIHCALPTRFIILSNELPRLDDASGTIISRFVFLQTERSFYGREDLELDNKLTAELPGILLWSIQGWQRLQERGRFLQPDAGLELLADLRDLASPIAAFARDCCEVNPTESVAIADLYAAWKRWCEEQGRDKFVSTVQVFGRDLVAAFPSIRRAQPRDGDGRVRIYVGIGLREGF